MRTPRTEFEAPSDRRIGPNEGRNTLEFVVHPLGWDLMKRNSWSKKTDRHGSWVSHGFHFIHRILKNSDDMLDSYNMLQIMGLNVDPCSTDFHIHTWLAGGLSNHLLLGYRNTAWERSEDRSKERTATSKVQRIISTTHLNT